MRVSVVIPCHNGAELTAGCIHSLLAQQDPHALEILVVDNGSSDDTPRLGQMAPQVRVLRQSHNRGFAGGVNAGIRAATAEHVLVLNNDTLAATNMLAELQRALVGQCNVGAVSPVSNLVKGAAMLPVGKAGADAVGREQIAADLAAAPPLQDVDTLAGLCLLVPRTTFDRVGLFDERFGHGNFEDDDFSLRMRLHGMRLFVAHRAFLHHVGHATFKALGLDVYEEIDLRRAQFCAKWQADPAGATMAAALRGDARATASNAAIAQRRWPQWPDADWHLARAAALRGEPELACHHLRTLLRCNPRHSAAALELFEQLLVGGDTDRALAHLRWTSENCHLSRAQLRRIFTRLGEHALACGSVHSARQQFQEALRLGPNEGQTHNWLGVCALTEGDLDAAVAAFSTAVDSGWAIGHTNLGITHHRRGDLPLAAKHFALAAELLPDDAVAAANLNAAKAWGDLTMCAAKAQAPPVRLPAQPPQASSGEGAPKRPVPARSPAAT